MFDTNRLTIVIIRDVLIWEGQFLRKSRPLLAQAVSHAHSFGLSNELRCDKDIVALSTTTAFMQRYDCGLAPRPQKVTLTESWPERGPPIW